MPQWEKMLASVGIGAAKMTVQIEEAILPRGSELHGTIALVGGNVPQHIEQIIVSVGYTTVVLVGKVVVPIYHEMAKTVVAEVFDIAPEQTQTLPFAITVPDNAPNGLTLSAQADIPGAVDPRATIQLELTASLEMLAVHDALQQLGFEAKSELRPHSLYAGRFTANYAAPAELRAAVENVLLWLKREEVNFVGALEINHQEHSFADAVKSLVRQDRTQSPLSFAWDDLYDANKQPRSEHLASLLKTAFESALKLPDEEKATLLRASFPPDVSDELLRPAADSEPNTANLLRPESSEHKQEDL